MKYRTIVADPPWPAIQGMDIRSRPVGTAGGWSRDSRPPYEMQSIDWIRGLPVDELAEGDAHLYLWIPAGLNRRGIGCLVAEAWGFNVVSEIVWCKPCFGMGKFPRPARNHPRLPARLAAVHEQYGGQRRALGSAAHAFTEARSIPRCGGDRQPRPLPRTIRPPQSFRLGYMGQRMPQRR